MKFFDFWAFQNFKKMASHDKIIFHMLFGAFQVTPRTTSPFLSHFLNCTLSKSSVSSQKPKVGQLSDQLIGTKTDLFSRRLKKIGVRIHTALVISSNILLRVKKSRYESYGIVQTAQFQRKCLINFEGSYWSISCLQAESQACLFYKQFNKLIIMDRTKWSQAHLLEWRQKSN